MGQPPTRAPRRSPSSRRGLLLALLGAPLLLVAAGLAAPQEDGAEELAADALERLSVALDDYELEAIEEAIVDLDTVYEKVSERTLKKILKALDGVLALEVRKELRYDGVDPSAELLPCYSLTVGLLYDKEAGGEVLTKALRRKHVQDWPDVEALILEGLGYRHERGAIGLFADYLEDPAAPVVVAAAEALGQYGEEPQDVRRECVRALVDAFVALQRAAEKEERKGKEETAQQHLVMVEGAFNTALSTLTRQRFGDPGSWQAWFSDHGQEEGW